jgi:hypothetical protein
MTPRRRGDHEQPLSTRHYGATASWERALGLLVERAWQQTEAQATRDNPPRSVEHEPPSSTRTKRHARLAVLQAALAAAAQTYKGSDGPDAPGEDRIVESFLDWAAREPDLPSTCAAARTVSGSDVRLWLADATVPPLGEPAAALLSARLMLLMEGIVLRWLDDPDLDELPARVERLLLFATAISSAALSGEGVRCARPSPSAPRPSWRGSSCDASPGAG